MEFGPFGLSEMLFIALLALVVFGPRRLPELGHTLGRWTVKLRRATADLRRTWETEVDAESTEALREAVREVRKVEADLSVAGREAWRETEQAGSALRRSTVEAGQAAAEAARSASSLPLPRSTPGPATPPPPVTPSPSAPLPPAAPPPGSDDAS